MFGMYTESAWRTIELAAEEAESQRGQGQVHGEHLVLALLRAGSDGEDAVGSRILHQAGVTETSFRAQLRDRSHPKRPFVESEQGTGGPLFGADMEFLMDRCVQLALDLGHARINTGHLLLGVLYQSGDLAAGALRRLDVEYESTYDAVVRESDTAEGHLGATLPLVASPCARRTGSASNVLGYARQLAEHDEEYQSRIGTHHYLLALMTESNGLAAKTLESFGLSYSTVRARIEELRPVTDPYDAPGLTPPTQTVPEAGRRSSDAPLTKGETEFLSDLGRRTVPRRRWWQRAFDRGRGHDR